MSRVFITASADASIYERYANLNTGHDEILEVGKKQDKLEISNGRVRSLIQFTLTDLVGAPTNSDAYLSLKLANATKLNQDARVYVYPVSRSWQEGSGYFEQSPIKSDDGATWTTYASGSNWSGSLPAAGTGSDYRLTPMVSASVTEIVNDELRINVTDIIQPMISGSSKSDNYGMLLTFSGSAEDDVNNVGNIKFFSRQTHTVHEPLLELVWSNQTFSTGSLKALTSLSDFEIAPKNMRAEYKAGEVVKMRFTIRDRYPEKTFANTRRFNNRYYLPSGSVYSIVDAGSGTTVVPFDLYSNVDCDTTGSYVMIDTKPLHKNRFYNLSLKTTLGSEVYFSRPFRFRVI